MASWSFGSFRCPPSNTMALAQVHLVRNQNKTWDVTLMRVNVLTGSAGTETKTFLTYDAAVSYVAKAS